MDLEEHCEETKKYFSKPYKEVHRWMDEFAKDYSLSERYKHRKHRHHLEGALEARDRFGEIGGLVALLHIMQDNDGYVPRKSEYNIPEYE